MTIFVVCFVVLWFIVFVAGACSGNIAQNCGIFLFLMVPWNEKYIQR